MTSKANSKTVLSMSLQLGKEHKKTSRAQKLVHFSFEVREMVLYLNCMNNTEQ